MVEGMTKGTREKWAARVREWRASGKTAREFAEGKGYTDSSLRWAEAKLGRGEASHMQAAEGPKPRVAERRAAVKADDGRAPRFVPVRVRATGARVAEVVVELGEARVRVPSGADVRVVLEVVRALQGGRR